MSTRRRHTVYDPVKRLLDLLFGVVALIATLPIQVVVAILVRVKLGRPVIFRHPRPGKNGEVFTMLKFRSMREPDPASGMNTDEERLTPFGRRLRSTSLDELPTLLNVVAGHMSFVGPRPLHVRYLERYTPHQARRHEVRPGITGLAQVNGRNALDWKEKLDLDVQYVDTRSLSVDSAILVRTIGLVLRREGISAEGHATAEEFYG